MKVILMTIFGLAMTGAAAHGQQGGDAVGTPGVEDGSCWHDSSGHSVSIKVRGTLHGDQKVTFTSGTDSGDSTGTPDPDGGCADAASTKVGSDSYRIKDGDVQRKNDAGHWLDLSKTTCPEPMIGTGNETIGSLPYQMSMRTLWDGETFHSLPA